jgi:hypothetical protein
MDEKIPAAAEMASTTLTRPAWSSPRGAFPYAGTTAVSGVANTATPPYPVVQH